MNIDAYIDLMYDEDNEIYYFQDFSKEWQPTSKPYKTKDAAMKAYKNNTIRWEKRHDKRTEESKRPQTSQV